MPRDEPKRLSIRAAGVAQWLKWRGIFVTDRQQSVVLWKQYAIYVAGARALPHHWSVAQMLDDTAAKYPGKLPALVRTIDRKVERAILHVRLEDALPLMEAIEEREIKR